MRVSHCTALCLACMLLTPTRHAMAADGLVSQTDAKASIRGSVTSSALTFDEALKIAERESSELKSLQTTESWFEGRVSAARQYPNPELEVFIEDLTPKRKADEPSPGNIRAELSQRLELGSKRSSRERLADAEGQIRKLEALLTRTRIHSEIGAALVQVFKLQEAKKLAGERSQLAGRLHQTGTDRVRAGKIAPIEETRLKSNATLARLELDEKGQELTSARLKLATLLGVDTANMNEVTFPFEDVSEPPALESLGAQLNRSAALRKTELEVQKSTAELGVEESQNIPDVTLKVDANYQRQEERYLFGAGLSLPLPLFDRNQGGKIMATAQVGAVSASAEKERQALRQGLEESYAELKFSLQKARILKNDVLPSLVETFSALEALYRQGRIGYLDVVESQESLFSVRERYLDALARYHTANFKIGYLTAQHDAPANGAVKKGMAEVSK